MGLSLSLRDGLTFAEASGAVSADDSRDESLAITHSAKLGPDSSMTNAQVLDRCTRTSDGTVARLIESRVIAENDGAIRVSNESVVQITRLLDLHAHRAIGPGGGLLVYAFHPRCRDTGSVQVRCVRKRKLAERARPLRHHGRRVTDPSERVTALPAGGTPLSGCQPLRPKMTSI